MFCFIFTIYNSSKDIKYSVKSLSVVLDYFENNNMPHPYILFIDDYSKDEETKNCLDFIKINLGRHLNYVTYLKNLKNIGLFKSLNKAISIIQNNHKLTINDDIKYVMFRDSDDYITTKTAHMAESCIEDNILVYPAIKLNMTRVELDDFCGEVADSKPSICEECEAAFVKPIYCDDRVFFGNDSEMLIEDSHKKLILRNLDDHRYSFYWGFNHYSLSIYNKNIFDILGGFDYHTINPGYTKSKDIDKLKVLAYVVNNFVRKAQIKIPDKNSYDIFKDSLDIIKDIVIKDPDKIPSIFKLLREGSLTQSDHHTDTYIYRKGITGFDSLKKNIFYNLNNLHKTSLILSKNTIYDIAKFFNMSLIDYMSRLYVKFDTDTEDQLLFRGNNWFII